MQLRGVIISRQCSIKPKVIGPTRGVVIGDSGARRGCTRADASKYGHKRVDTGTIINESLVWGAQSRRALFSRFGVSGVVNVDPHQICSQIKCSAWGQKHLPKG